MDSRCSAIESSMSLLREELRTEIANVAFRSSEAAHAPKLFTSINLEGETVSKVWGRYDTAWLRGVPPEYAPDEKLRVGREMIASFALPQPAGFPKLHIVGTLISIQFSSAAATDSFVSALKTAFDAKGPRIKLGSSLVRGALDECEELRARRMVAISILRAFSALRNKDHFPRGITRREGAGLVGHASEDHSAVFIRMMENGRAINVQVCKDIEGFPTARVSWYNAAFSKLGEPASIALKLQKEAFS